MSLPENHNKPSSRHHVVDTSFAAILEDDFGIPSTTILDALEGEPKKTAIAVCEWAAEKTDDPAFALTSWARKYHKGRCRRAAHTTTERSARRHGSPGDDRAGDGRGSGPASERSIAPRRSYVLDPARVRANVERMGD